MKKAEFYCNAFRYLREDRLIILEYLVDKILIENKYTAFMIYDSLFSQCFSVDDRMKLMLMIVKKGIKFTKDDEEKYNKEECDDAATIRFMMNKAIQRWPNWSGLSDYTGIKIADEIRKNPTGKNTVELLGLYFKLNSINLPDWDILGASQIEKVIRSFYYPDNESQKAMSIAKKVFDIAINRGLVYFL